jgi:hypothetical protein
MFTPRKHIASGPHDRARGWAVLGVLFA